MKKVSPVAYPFLTKRAIAAKIDAEPDFTAECALLLQQRTSERLAGHAPPGKPWGWMSSEAVTAGKLVARLRSGTISDGDRAKLGKLTRRYVKQLAQHSVALALREHPELAEIAVKFGVFLERAAEVPAGQSAQSAEAIKPSTEPSEQSLEETPPSTRDEPDVLATRLLVLVGRNPGQRTEDMAKALVTTTAMLGPVLRELVLGRKLMKRGIGRGTRYFVR